jgi:hypothetical protein
MTVRAVACGKQAIDVFVSWGWERPSCGFGIFFFCTSETSREEAGAERVVPDPLQREDAMFLQRRVLWFACVVDGVAVFMVRECSRPFLSLELISGATLDSRERRSLHQRGR